MVNILKNEISIRLNNSLKYHTLIKHELKLGVVCLKMK